MGYISFDVDKIQNYVFASYRPLDIHGASELVKTVEEDGEVLKEFLSRFSNPEIIFAAGGTGLIKIDSSEFRDEFLLEFEKLYEIKTHGSLTAVFHPAEKFNETVFKSLQAKLRFRKSEKGLYETLSECLSHPNKLCDACGLLEHDGGPTDRNENLCIVCRKKRETGRKSRKQGEYNQADSLEDIAKLADETMDNIAIIYADLSNMGKILMEHAEDESTLRDFSNNVYSRIKMLIDKIVVENKLDGRFIAPVIGGDDLVLVIPSGSVFNVVNTILDSNELFLKEFNTFFSVAFATSNYKYPISLLFESVKNLLQEAKEVSRKMGECVINFKRLTGHEFGTVLMRRYKIGREPSCKPYTENEFREILNEIQEIYKKNIPSSLLHRIYEIINEIDSHDEIDLNIQYILSKRKTSELPERWIESLRSVNVIRKIFYSSHCNRFNDIIELLKIGGQYE